MKSPLRGGFIVQVFLILCFLFWNIDSSFALVRATSADACFRCHKIKLLKKKLVNRKIMSLYVNPEEFKNSVHGKRFNNCLVCHKDIAQEKRHPIPRKIVSKESYRFQMEKRCLICHPLTKLPPIHKKIAIVGRLDCVKCHGNPHYIVSKEENVKLSEKCLRCHSIKRLAKVLPNGEKMSLYVDKERYFASVHGKMLSCLSCHKDIAQQKRHPVPRKIPSKEWYKKKISKNCLTCHPLITLGSFHRVAINERGLTCVDCHTSHYVKSTKKIKKMSEGCVECHQVHRLPKVLANGDKMYLYVNPKEFNKTPHAKYTCFACHHDIYNMRFHPKPLKIPSKEWYAKKVSQNCFVCHSNEQLSKYPPHALVIKSGLKCIDCHGYHSNIYGGGVNE